MISGLFVGAKIISLIMTINLSSCVNGVVVTDWMPVYATLHVPPMWPSSLLEFLSNMGCYV